MHARYAACPPPCSSTAAVRADGLGAGDNGGVSDPGDDVRVPPGPGLPQGLVVPAGELLERFSRSAGPGGQGVNTTDSRVELVLDVGASKAFTPAQRTRLEERLAGRLVDGRITIAASEHRAQLRNRAAARERLAALLREALAPPPPPRRPTRPTRGSQQRRLDGKRRRAEVKSGRGRVQRDG
jgi:ribosome-associated protein